MAIATYRRPDGLRRLLESCGRQSGVDLHVVVVDNDPAGSAEQVARDFPGVTYVVEPTPGISAARNRGIRECLRLPVDWLAFVDDDEHLDDSWATQMAAFVSSRDVDVVGGPVIPVFRADAPAWVVRGRFFDRPRAVSGSPGPGAATNNALVRVDALGALRGEYFKEDWSHTGGSDGEFFHRLRSLGARTTYCDEALVYEAVPAGRTTARWLYRRGVRLGNVSARLKIADGWGPPRLAAAGLARVVCAVPIALVALVRGRPVGPAVMHLPKGIGMLRALRGKLHHEYARA